MVQIRLLIDSVDRSGILLEPPDGDWEIEQNSFGEIDTASFTLDDKTNTLSLNSGKQVIIEKFSDSGTRYFGGVLTEVVEVAHGIGRRFNCKALGWTFDLQRAVVNFIYIGKSDQFIITDPTTGIFGANGAGKAVEKDLSAYTATTATVEEGNSNTNKVVLQGTTIRELMDMFSGWAGYVWGVTPLQVIYFRPYTTLTNAETLSDNPDAVTSFPYYGLRRFRNFSEIVNRVYIYGARASKENQIRQYSNESSIKTDFIVPDEWRASDSQADHKIVVEKNTGSDASPAWAVQTVGLPQEVGTFDVIWHELGRQFLFTTAPLVREKAFRVSGDIFEPLSWDEPDQPSIDANGEYAVTIKDSTLRDEDVVELRAHAELRKRSAAGERITLMTTRDGFEVGKLITLTHTILGINAVSYLCNEIVMRPLGGSESEYELTLQRVP